MSVPEWLICPLYKKPLLLLLLNCADFHATDLHVFIILIKHPFLSGWSSAVYFMSIHHSLLSISSINIVQTYKHRQRLPPTLLMIVVFFDVLYHSLFSNNLPWRSEYSGAFGEKANINPDSKCLLILQYLIELSSESLQDTLLRLRDLKPAKQ